MTKRRKTSRQHPPVNRSQPHVAPASAGETSGTAEAFPAIRASRPAEQALPITALPGTALPDTAPAQPVLPSPEDIQLPASRRPAEPDIRLAAGAAELLGTDGTRAASLDTAPQALPGWQSLGPGGKARHENGRQGPRERKVRW